MCCLPTLPDYLADMALFAVNTGCRDAEICNLRWEWEVAVPQMGTSVFIIPGDGVKNGEDRLVALNDVARSIVDRCRGVHATHVFTYRGKPIRRMLTSAWVRAPATSVCTTSSTRLAVACARSGCRSRTDRTFSGIVPGGSPPTTLLPNLRA